MAVVDQGKAVMKHHSCGAVWPRQQSAASGDCHQLLCNNSSAQMWEMSPMEDSLQWAVSVGVGLHQESL